MRGSPKMNKSCPGARTVAARDKREHRITPAAEWLLDNYYLIEEQIRTARRHLPKGYSRELPRLAAGASVGSPAFTISPSRPSHTPTGAWTRKVFGAT